MNRTGILIANGALLILCCFLAARVLAAVAAEFLAPPPAEVTALSQQVDPTRQGTHDPQVILGRNLFKVSTLGSPAFSSQRRSVSSDQTLPSPACFSTMP